MARRRVQFDGNFEAEVYRAASGLEATGRRFRTRRTTLQDVANDIVEESKRLVDMPARRTGFHDKGGLPSRGPGGGRTAGYPFRRTVTGPTYRSSFKAKVEKQAGRLVVVVSNDHLKAEEIEYGNQRSGSRLRPKNSEFLALPITNARFQKGQKSRNLKLNERRAKGWPSASIDRRTEYQYRYRRKRKAISRMTPARYGAILQQPKISRATGAKSFVRKDEAGRPWLFTRSVKSSDGYKILRRAMRNVARRKFG